LPSAIERVYDVGVFERLAHDVENLVVPGDGAGLRELLAVRDLLDAALCEAVAAFDAAGSWDLDAAVSMQAWLRDRAGLTFPSANRLVRTARRVAAMPLTQAAWRAGRLRGGQIELVVANVAADDVDVYVAHEARVVESIEALSTDETGDFLRSWKAHVDALKDRPPRDRAGKVHLSDGLDGHGFLDGELDAEANQLLKTALRLAESPDAEGEPRRSPAKRRHDALADVARFFLDHQHDKVGGRHRPHLNVLVDLAADAARYVDGAAISRDVLERYFCDSALHRLLARGRSTILDLGTATRVVSAALWVALVARDQHCRFPGCDRPAHWCEGHHVVWVSRDGPTNLANLVLVCSRHHHLLHLPGWSATLALDGTLTVGFPDGAVRTTAPPKLADAFW
jgi:hypothetical protein